MRKSRNEANRWRMLRQQKLRRSRAMEAQSARHRLLFTLRGLRLIQHKRRLDFLLQ